MASEYLNWKFRDVKPEEKREYTKKELRANWWHYHKWHVILGIVGIAALIDIGRSAFHIGETMPDLQVAYVGTREMPEAAKEALEEQLAAFMEDANEDGKVVVQVNTYVFPEDEDTSSEETTSSSSSGDSAYYKEAARVSLMADLESCDSFLFLLEDYETFQSDYMILANTDGSLPEEYANAMSGLCYAWDACPALASLDLGTYEETIAGITTTGDNNEFFSSLYIGRRGFWTEKTCENAEACEECWMVLTEGAE